MLLNENLLRALRRTCGARIYNAFGNLEYVTDARGSASRVKREYDNLDRLLHVLYDESDPTNPAKRIDFAYGDDASTFSIGRMVEASDPRGTTTFEWNRRGLLWKETRSMAGRNGTTTYDYDLNGNISTLHYPYSMACHNCTKLAHRPVFYVRDKADRVIELKTIIDNPTSSIVSIIQGVTHLPFGPYTGGLFFNGVVETRSYDESYAISRETVASTSGTLLDREYTTDEDGLINGVTDWLDVNRNRTYDYDRLHRLSVANGVWGSGGYTYDRNGNLLTREDGNGLITYSYTDPSRQNRLMSMSGGVTSTLDYGVPPLDELGQIYGDGTNSFGYGVTNRLETGNALTYGHDAFQRRVYRLDPRESPSRERLTAYVGGWKALDTLEEDAVLFPTPKNGVTHSYVWLGGAPVADIGQVANIDRIVAIHSDYLGTPQITTDSSGLADWTGEYNPFGELIASTSVGTPLTLPGMWNDTADDALYQNWHREFSPVAGRYLQPDPILDPGVSPYAYVRGNPLGFVDPSGLEVYVSDAVLADAIDARASANPEVARTIAAHTGTCQHVRDTGGKNLVLM